MNLYRADGRPAGKPFPFSTNPDQCGSNQQVAFADNGTFAAIWNVSPDATKADIYFARFSASPADEPCLARAGHLLCDTGRTGGLPEIDIWTVCKNNACPEAPAPPGRYRWEALTRRRLSAHLLQHDPRDVGGIGVTGQEDVGRGDLLGLGGVLAPRKPRWRAGSRRPGRLRREGR
jgi:hypothetical protein